MIHSLPNDIGFVLVIAVLAYISPLLFIAADLWAGIRKAKERGERITSRKMRDTIAKLNRYYNSLLALSVLDALQMALCWYIMTARHWSVVFFPVMTFLGAVFIGIVEVKSIVEPATAKQRRERDRITRLAQNIAKHPTKVDEITKDIVDYIKED